MFEREYRIVPSVTAYGQPEYTLYKDYGTPYGAGSLKLASNSDRAVLEHAIEHLSQGKEVKP